jgi:hypothetical protein
MSLEPMTVAQWGISACDGVRIRCLDRVRKLFAMEQEKQRGRDRLLSAKAAFDNSYLDYLYFLFLALSAKG